MQFMLSFTEPAADFAKRTNPELAPIYWSSWMSYIDAMGAAGIIVSGNGLEAPSTATQLRLRDGKRQIHDGPYPDTKEHLGGYFIIEVPSLDDALAWAERSPAALTGNVEIRPVMPPPKKR